MEKTNIWVGMTLSLKFTDENGNCIAKLRNYPFPSKTGFLKVTVQVLRKFNLNTVIINNEEYERTVIV